MLNSEQLTRPSKVAAAVTLMYASIVIWIIRCILITPYLLERRLMVSPFIIMSFILAILLFFTYMTGKGKNWARITILAIFILRILFSIVYFCVPESRSIIMELFSDHPPSSVIGLLEFCLNFAGLLLLFQRDSSTWFRGIEKLMNAQPVI